MYSTCTSGTVSLSVSSSSLASTHLPSHLKAPCTHSSPDIPDIEVTRPAPLVSLSRLARPPGVPGADVGEAARPTAAGLGPGVEADATRDEAENGDAGRGVPGLTLMRLSTKLLTSMRVVRGGVGWRQLPYAEITAAP